MNDFVPRLDTLKCIGVTSSIEEMKKICDLLKEKLPQYNISFYENDTVNNTIYKTPEDEWDDNYEYVPIPVDYKIVAHLQGCKHNNFNFKIFYYNSKIYFDPGPYEYAEYIIECCFGMISKYLQTGKFSLNYMRYDEYILSKNERMARHQYNCDKEDLQKLGIIV